MTGKMDNFFGVMENNLVEDDDLGDPDLPDAQASKEEWEIHKNEVQRYAQEMLSILRNTKYMEEEAWIEFTCTFRSCTIDFLNATNVFGRTEYLLSRDVFVRDTRGNDRRVALKECIQSADYVACGASCQDRVKPDEQEFDDEDISEAEEEHTPFSNCTIAENEHAHLGHADNSENNNYPLINKRFTRTCLLRTQHMSLLPSLDEKRLNPTMHGFLLEVPPYDV